MTDPTLKQKRRDKITKDLHSKKYHQRIVPSKKKKELNEAREEDIENDLVEYFED